MKLSGDSQVLTWFPKFGRSLQKVFFICKQSSIHFYFFHQLVAGAVNKQDRQVTMKYKFPAVLDFYSD